MKKVSQVKTRATSSGIIRARPIGTWGKVSPVATLATYALLSLVAAVTVLPFLWMLSTSLKYDADMFSTTPEWIPPRFNWGNYTKIWTLAPFTIFFLNTAKVTLLVVVGRLIICSMAAYAFARLRFRGRDALFLVYLATMMVPYQVTIVPNYIIMTQLNWVNTHLAIIVPYWFSAFGVFMLRQFFMGIPRELEEAARIDGSSFAGTYWRIVLPLSTPGLVALGIFTFLGTWNDFMGPLIFLNSLDKFTLSVGLSSLVGIYKTDWTVLMTGSVLTVTPIILLFVFAQKYILEGITLQGSVKG